MGVMVELEADVARDLIEVAGSVDKAWNRFYRRAGITRKQFRDFVATIRE